MNEVDSEETFLMDAVNGGNHRPQTSTFTVDNSEFYDSSMNATSFSNPSLDQTAPVKLHLLQNAIATKRYIEYCNTVNMS